MTDPREEVLQRFLDEWRDGEFLVPEIIAHVYDAGKKAQREEDAGIIKHYEERLAFLGNALNPDCPPFIGTMSQIAWDALEWKKKEFPEGKVEGER